MCEPPGVTEDYGQLKPKELCLTADEETGAVCVDAGNAKVPKLSKKAARRASKRQREEEAQKKQDAKNEADATAKEGVDRKKEEAKAKSVADAGNRLKQAEKKLRDCEALVESQNAKDEELDAEVKKAEAARAEEKQDALIAADASAKEGVDRKTKLAAEATCKVARMPQ